MADKRWHMRLVLVTGDEVVLSSDRKPDTVTLERRLRHPDEVVHLTQEDGSKVLVPSRMVLCLEVRQGEAF